MDAANLTGVAASFAPLPLSDSDFHRLTAFVHKIFGIDLSKKRELIAGRLSYSVKAMGYPSFTSFIDHLLRTGDPAETELMLNRLTTNYTFFMREPEHFAFFRDTILPDLVRRHEKDRVLSIWSAGCASGEEPYTISMCLMDYLGASAGRWNTRVLATDISQQALSKAKEARYELPAGIPPDWKRKYFVREGERYRVSQTIRDNVNFRTFNLMDSIRFPMKFDVIFCRNVMIYFDRETRDGLISRFCEATAPEGYLLIGHSETLGKNPGYRYLAPATFRKQ